MHSNTMRRVVIMVVSMVVTKSRGKKALIKQVAGHNLCAVVIGVATAALVTNTEGRTISWQHSDDFTHRLFQERIQPIHLVFWGGFVGAVRDKIGPYAQRREPCHGCPAQ